MRRLQFQQHNNREVIFQLLRDSSQATTGELKKEFELEVWRNSKIEFKLLDLGLVSRQEVCI